MEFMQLSSEIHLHIISFLPISEVYTGISQTCKRLSVICKSSYVWQGKYFKLSLKDQVAPGPLLCHSAVHYKDDKGLNQMIFYGGNQSSTNIIENVKKHLWCYQFDEKKMGKIIDLS